MGEPPANHQTALHIQSQERFLTQMNTDKKKMNTDKKRMNTACESAGSLIGLAQPSHFNARLSVFIPSYLCPSVFKTSFKSRHQAGSRPTSRVKKDF